VVVLLADHGDMLGERGLWYKMNFFEGSARVPMIVHAPKRFGPRRVAAPVSLVDVLPTVTELVGAAAPEHLEPSAGRSLLDLCAGGPSAEREVVGEYLGEGAVAPIVMIRRGDLKYVHSPVDPDQLYDLAADPQERVNLALDADWSVPVKELRARVERDWDMDALHADVVADQARRRLVNAALRTGTVTPWEYTPPHDGGGQYMRNHLDLNVVERASRYPR
jgi:choline-sulfatase